MYTNSRGVEVTVHNMSLQLALDEQYEDGYIIGDVKGFSDSYAKSKSERTGLSYDTCHKEGILIAICDMMEKNHCTAKYVLDLLRNHAEKLPECFAQLPDWPQADA
ncbi:hypothetical protein IJT93_07710 [bacterium]|nr:hypothetical protein [bacterium]